MYLESIFLSSFFVVALLTPIVEKQDEEDSFHYLTNARFKRQIGNSGASSSGEKEPQEATPDTLVSWIENTTYQNTSESFLDAAVSSGVEFQFLNSTELYLGNSIKSFHVSTEANLYSQTSNTDGHVSFDSTRLSSKEAEYQSILTDKQNITKQELATTVNIYEKESTLSTKRQTHQIDYSTMQSFDENANAYLTFSPKLIPTFSAVTRADTLRDLNESSGEQNSIEDRIESKEIFNSNASVNNFLSSDTSYSTSTATSVDFFTTQPIGIKQITTTVKSKFPSQTENYAQVERRTSATPPFSGSSSSAGLRPLYPYTSLTSSAANAITEGNCNFGNGRTINLCQWMNLSLTKEKWSASRGQNYGWLGGPPVDNTQGTDEGGYGLYETSKLVDSQFSQSLAFDSAMLMSPIIQKTDAVGICIDFWYAMDGLSQDRLRILLRPPSPTLEIAKRLNMTDQQLKTIFMESDGRDDIVLWENRDTTGGKWKNGQVVYSFNDRHLIIFEGIPLSITDPNRAYQGYISLDDFNFIYATDCKPFCNFEGGFCSWSQDLNDDFDWSLSRGSINPSTGPPMDRFSFNYGIKGGGYAFINSGYPRRPGDKARLLSDEFSPPGPDSPQCMRFWTHMFGNGVGTLRILVIPRNGLEEVIYELRGEQGNNWYQGQVTITADTNFQIAIEAEVGNNNLGDIAIDEISLKEGACPTSPQSASKITGDCTFEVDECGWRNVDVRQRLDELDWERVVASTTRAPNSDHTLKTSSGSYMTLPRTTVQRGERGWLVSPPIKAKRPPYCISFWYYMYDPFIEQSGPSLGSLTVMMMEQDNSGSQILKPIWELRNHQGPNWQYGQAAIDTSQTFTIIFEGLWGNSRGSEFIAIDDISFFMGNCKTLPTQATSSFLDCDFTRSSCSYFNATSQGGDQWLPASISRRPSTLADHTYGGPVGYIYFDVFNTNANEPPKVTLMSRVILADAQRNPKCLSLWFAPIGNDQATTLSINRESADASINDATGRNGTPLLLWKVNAKDVYKDRIEWMFGQIQIDTSTDFKISIVGTARKGGFAIDDIKVFPGPCRQRPAELPRSQPLVDKEQTVV